MVQPKPHIRTKAGIDMNRGGATLAAACMDSVQHTTHERTGSWQDLSGEGQLADEGLGIVSSDDSFATERLE
jgi:hypothetical protein